MDKTDQEPEHAADPAAPTASEPNEMNSQAPLPAPPSATGQPWDNAAEEAWSEHSATAWALVYVIHRIRSTPLPPVLLPEQRRHFHKIIQMAAALLEDWQRSERDQAQQLALRGLITELSAEFLEAEQDHHGQNSHAGGQVEHEFTSSHQQYLEEVPEDAANDQSDHEADEAHQDQKM
jgi:hypothetical protein